MKFQIPSIHHSKVNRRTHAHTDRQTDKPKAICPSNFFKVGDTITPRPLYNMARYNTVLDITLITDGPQLNYFCHMYIHFTLMIITRIG